MTMTLATTPAGSAMLTMLNEPGDTAQALLEMLGSYHVNVLEAIENEDELAMSPDCLRAIADLVEKGFVS